MFFTVSKILWAILSPATLIALLLCGGFLARHHRAGNLALLGGCVAILLVGVFPLGKNLCVFLENTIVAQGHLPKEPDGIIILGGFIDLETSVARQQIALNDNSSRLTTFLTLAKEYPNAKLVFTGGDGNLKQTSSSEAKQLDNLLSGMGFDTSRLIFEGRSRNTYENMMYTKELLKPQEGERWLLVTSAFHMPRSIAVFRAGGWKVTPYPTAYLTEGGYEWLPDFDVLGNMSKFQVAVREILGIMAYILTDKIKPHDITEIFFRSACDPSQPVVAAAHC